MTLRRSFFRRSVWVATAIPATTGVVHEAGVPARPSISTRQRRHEPKASSESVAQSFGTLMPASIAARMIDVPSGTDTVKPSMVKLTVLSVLAAGVPKSISLISAMSGSLFGGGEPAARAEILGKMLQCAQHGIRREPAQRAQQTELHGHAQLFDQRHIRRDILAAPD